MHTGKQHFLCRQCRYWFIEHPWITGLTQATREVVARSLLEYISMAGIALAVRVSEQWLQNYGNLKTAQIPQQAEVRRKKGLMECNAMNCGLLWAMRAINSVSGRSGC